MPDKVIGQKMPDQLTGQKMPDKLIDYYALGELSPPVPLNFVWKPLNAQRGSYCCKGTLVLAGPTCPMKANKFSQTLPLLVHLQTRPTNYSPDRLLTMMRRNRLK